MAHAISGAYYGATLSEPFQKVKPTFDFCPFWEGIATKTLAA